MKVIEVNNMNQCDKRDYIDQKTSAKLLVSPCQTLLEIG